VNRLKGFVVFRARRGSEAPDHRRCRRCCPRLVVPEHGPDSRKPPKNWGWAMARPCWDGTLMVWPADRDRNDVAGTPGGIFFFFHSTRATLGTK